MSAPVISIASHWSRIRPSVSVLIAAWNEEPTIERCLDSLLEIQFPEIEIIVCAGGNDKTSELVRRYESRHVLCLDQHSGEGKQTALRRCFDRSSGNILYFTDADCVIPKKALENVIAPIANGSAKATTGGSVPLCEQIDNQLVRYQWGKDVAWHETQSHHAVGVYGRNFALSREIIEQLQPFDADVPSGTDYHVSQLLRRAGVSIAWCESLVCSEYPSTPQEYIRKWRRWIKNVLVQGTQTRSYAEICVAVLGVTASATLVLLPVAAVVIDRRLFIPWLGLFGLITSRRVRTHSALVQRGLVPEIWHWWLRTPAYVLLDAISSLAGLVAAVLPSMRGGW